MSWQVTWRVISGGPVGARENDGSGIIYQGERVKFSVRPNSSESNYLDTIRHAEQPETWERSPAMTVIGVDRNRVVSVPVRHVPDNLLEFEYLFRYEGNKTLRFEGTPAVMDVGRMFTRPSPSRLETPFDALRLELQVGVQPFQIGAHAQTMEGRSPRYRQAREELEDLRERVRAGDPETARAEAESSAQHDADRRVERAAARPGAHESEGVRRAYSRGLLHYELKDEFEVGRMSGVELDDYLSGLDAAVRITPGFRMYEGGNGSRPIGHLNATDRWQVEYRSERNQVAFFVEGNLTGTRRMTPRGYIDTYPTTESRREYRESVRAETLHIFPEDAWVVLQTSRSASSKSLVHVRQLAQIIESDRFWATVEGMVTLGSMVLTMGRGRPVMAVADLGFGVLSRLLLPQEAQVIVAGASMLSGLISGLRSLISLGRTAVRGLRTARGLAGTATSGGGTIVRPRSGGSAVTEEVEIGRSASRGVSTGSRGTPPGSVGPDPQGTGGGGSMGSRAGTGRRRSVYRGPDRPVEGYHDVDGRSITAGERVPRSSGEILGDLSTREYRVAQALGREGREVVRLPNEGEWDALIRQQGWSRDRVRRLMRRVREAQERDNLLTTRNPDLLVNGRVWDIITQGIRGELNGGVSSALRTLIDKGVGRQTRRVIVDFSGYSSRLPEIRTAFRQALAALETQQPLRFRQFHQFIDEIAITVGDRIFTMYSRGQGISF